MAAEGPKPICHCGKDEQFEVLPGWVWPQTDYHEAVSADQRQRARIVALFRDLAGLRIGEYTRHDTAQARQHFGRGGWVPFHGHAPKAARSAFQFRSSSALASARL